MRDAAIDRFLHRTGRAGWTRSPVSGDASARRYLRLAGPDGDSLILMDADPASAGPQDVFVSLARHLRQHGLAAPNVIDADTAQGLLLLEDLGTVDIARHLALQPGAEDALAAAVLDVLTHLSRLPAPPGLVVLTPETGAAMLDPLPWYAPAATPAALASLASGIGEALSRHARAPETLSLRDFHAENLIWRPSCAGLDRIGLLDFQDAFLAPPAYDLVSYLHDARRDVPPASRTMALIRFAEMTGTSHATLTSEAAVLTLQRNLRILGIFARLARRDGKARYLALLPRVWGHVMTALDHPALAALRQRVTEALPAPDVAHVSRLETA